jgi:hypothetical protein
MATTQLKSLQATRDGVFRSAIADYMLEDFSDRERQAKYKHAVPFALLVRT